MLEVTISLDISQRLETVMASYRLTAAQTINLKIIQCLSTQQPQIVKANTSERNVPARNAAEEPLEVYHRWKGLRSGHLDTKLSPEDEAQQSAVSSLPSSSSEP